MNRSFFALFIALLIHFVFLLLYLRFEELKPEVKRPIQEKKLKISLKELVKKKTTQKTTSPKLEKKFEPTKEMPVMPKGSQLKKILKQEPVKYQPKAKPKKTKLNPTPIVKKPQPKVKKIQALPPTKPYIPFKKSQEEKIIPKKIIKKKKEPSSMDWLLDDKSNEIQTVNKSQNSHGTSAGRNIQELYGDEFGKLSQGQQEYILNNQEIMRRITQGVLNRQASVSNIESVNANRSNVIEFYLHTDGSMSDFKFLDKSGYFILDEITRVTIEYSYAKYPRPTEKTLIRYNVFYNLLR